MNKLRDEQRKGADLAKTNGEQERDNDAHRPEGSTGTSQDSTAQKAAREAPRKGREQ